MKIKLKEYRKKKNQFVVFPLVFFVAFMGGKCFWVTVIDVNLVRFLIVDLLRMGIWNVLSLGFWIFQVNL